MITAKEARKLLEDELHKSVDSHLVKIESKIKDSIKNLKGEVHYYDTVPIEVTKFLRDLGYEIEECNSQLDGYMLIIRF